MEAMLTKTHPEERLQVQLAVLGWVSSILPAKLWLPASPKSGETEYLLRRARSKDVLKINSLNIFKHALHV